jgi:hypothetical protein
MMIDMNFFLGTIFFYFMQWYLELNIFLCLQLNDKDQSLLDERIKRSLKNKPAPKAKEEERPKTAPTQPQRSASQ